MYNVVLRIKVGSASMKKYSNPNLRRTPTRVHIQSTRGKYQVLHRRRSRRRRPAGAAVCGGQGQRARTCRCCAGEAVRLAAEGRRRPRSRVLARQSRAPSRVGAAPRGRRESVTGPAEVPARRRPGAYTTPKSCGLSQCSIQSSAKSYKSNLSLTGSVVSTTRSMPRWRGKAIGEARRGTMEFGMEMVLGRRLDGTTSEAAAGQGNEDGKKIQFTVTQDMEKLTPNHGRKCWLEYQMNDYVASQLVIYWLQI